MVRKRGRAIGEEEEEEEDNQRASKQQKMDSLQSQMAKLLEGMEELKKNVTTKEDIRGVNSRLRTIEMEHKSFETRLTKIERDKANMSRPTVGPRPRPLNADKSSNDSADFRKARRSLLISPVEADLDSVRKYLCNEMDMPVDVVEDLQLEDIRPIHPKKVPAHRKESAETKKKTISICGIRMSGI